MTTPDLFLQASQATQRAATIFKSAELIGYSAKEANVLLNLLQQANSDIQKVAERLYDIEEPKQPRIV